MGKSLSQITFDFAPVEETENTLTTSSSVIEKETVVMEEKKPAVTLKEPNKDITVPVVATGKRGRKSLKEIAISADLIQVPEDEILFKKQYYAIGEVATMFRENQSLIRYWETEFDILQPRKNRKGDRFFRPVDIKNLVMIYDLLRRRKFTIEGAKDYLKKNKKAEEKFAMMQSLEKIKGFLLELKASL
jgi:DNA-binding transcriptional MerR regulator